MSVSSLVLMGLWQEMFAVQGLLLNEAHIILGWVHSMLFCDFWAWLLRSISTSSVVALREFFHADANTNVHRSLISWYLSLVYYGNIYVLVHNLSRTCFFTYKKDNAVSKYGHLLLDFFLVDRHHFYRWVAVVFWLNYFILRFLCPGSGEVCHWHIFGFICFSSYLLCCILWFLWQYVCVAHVILSILKDCLPVISQDKITIAEF